MGRIGAFVILHQLHLPMPTNEDRILIGNPFAPIEVKLIMAHSIEEAPLFSNTNGTNLIRNLNNSENCLGIALSYADLK